MFRLYVIIIHIIHSSSYKTWYDMYRYSMEFYGSTFYKYIQMQPMVLNNIYLQNWAMFGVSM
jgi:hypothetical protein